MKNFIFTILIISVFSLKSQDFKLIKSNVFKERFVEIIGIDSNNFYVIGDDWNHLSLYTINKTTYQEINFKKIKNKVKGKYFERNDKIFMLNSKIFVHGNMYKVKKDKFIYEYDFVKTYNMNLELISENKFLTDETNETYTQYTIFDSCIYFNTIGIDTLTFIKYDFIKNTLNIKHITKGNNLIEFINFKNLSDTLKLEKSRLPIFNKNVVSNHNRLENNSFIDEYPYYQFGKRVEENKIQINPVNFDYFLNMIRIDSTQFKKIYPDSVILGKSQYIYLHNRDKTLFDSIIKNLGYYAKDYFTYKRKDGNKVFLGKCIKSKDNSNSVSNFYLISFVTDKNNNLITEVDNHFVYKIENYEKEFIVPDNYYKLLLDLKLYDNCRLFLENQTETFFVINPFLNSYFDGSYTQNIYVVKIDSDGEIHVKTISLIQEKNYQLISFQPIFNKDFCYMFYLENNKSTEENYKLTKFDNIKDLNFVCVKYDIIKDKMYEKTIVFKLSDFDFLPQIDNIASYYNINEKKLYHFIVAKNKKDNSIIYHVVF